MDRALTIKSKWNWKVYHEVSGVESPYKAMRYAYDTQGNLQDTWDSNNNLTHQEYDDLGRVVKIVNALAEETILTYANDRLEQIEIGKTLAAGEGQVIKYNYDTNNRLQTIQRKNDVGIFVTFESYTYYSDGKVHTKTDAESHTWTYQYDLAGRLKSVTDPKLNITQIAYDAMNLPISQIDANAHETKITYDDLGRRLAVQQLGIIPSITTNFSYDAVGNLTAVTDGNGHTTQYTYDTLSRKTTETKPLGQTLQYFYTDRNQLDYLLNARGQKIDYRYYDWGGLQDIRHYQNATTTTVDRSISYQYYNTGTTQTVTDTAIAGTPVYTYTYDALNRPDITTISNYPGGNKTLNNDYNRFGHRNTLTFTDSSGSVTHQYTYNKLGQLSSATLPGTQTFTGFEYFANNQLKHITAPGGINLDYTYETNGPVKTIGYTNGAVSLDNLSYTYDATRNVDTLTNTNGLHDYNYDNLYRLTGATHPVSSGLPTAESFTYDDAGNRENPADLAAYDYDNNNRITTSPGVTSYGFDADGNTTSKTGGEIFGYNHNNQLTSYSKPGTTASYVYDVAARRINKTINGTTTWYLWDGSKLLAEYNSSGTRTKRYAYLPNNFAPVQMADSTGTYNVLSNHLQTPILLTNSSNQIVWRANYEAFGKATINDDVDGNGVHITFNVRMPGQYYDAESNLSYNRHRYYSTELGRYITSDPIGLKGGINTYNYVENNPVNWVDQLGLAGAQCDKNDDGNDWQCDGDLCTNTNENLTCQGGVCWYTQDPMQNVEGDSVIADLSRWVQSVTGGKNPPVTPTRYPVVGGASRW